LSAVIRLTAPLEERSKKSETRIFLFICRGWSCSTSKARNSSPLLPPLGLHLSAVRPQIFFFFFPPGELLLCRIHTTAGSISECPWSYCVIRGASRMPRANFLTWYLLWYKSLQFIGLNSMILESLGLWTLYIVRNSKEPGIQLVPYDAVNPNKVSIRQLPFISHSLHVSALRGHLKLRYTIRYFKDYFEYNGSVARTQFASWKFISVSS
jgi:hypothetical protein